MNEWLLIMLMALVTFVPRYLPFALAGKLKLPAAMEQALSFVPIAVLSAIVAQTSLIHEGSIDLSWQNYHAVAALAAFVAALVTRHLFATIGTGLVVFATLRLVF
jgi:branched-subunit amino acid transport protein